MNTVTSNKIREQFAAMSIYKDPQLTVLSSHHSLMWSYQRKARK